MKWKLLTVNEGVERSNSRALEHDIVISDVAKLNGLQAYHEKIMNNYPDRFWIFRTQIQNVT